MTKRIMLLTHTGRASGRPRHAALEVVEHGDDGSIVAASGFGRAADWYKNVRKTPEVTIRSAAALIARGPQSCPPKKAVTSWRTTR